MIVSKKNILITGGANGIGKAITQDLISKGAIIFVIDKSKSDLEVLKNNNNAIITYECDISDQHKLEETMNKIEKKAGVIDILINSAGIMHNEPLVKFEDGTMKVHSLDTWEKVIAVNLTGCFHVTSLVAKNMMLNRVKGLIINLSSISSKGNIGQSAYSVSKAGMEALTKTLSKELSFMGIRSTGIAPGFIDTPATRKAITDNQIKQLSKLTPANRLGEVNEIVSAVNMIIENDFFNGKIIEVDGGLVF